MADFKVEWDVDGFKTENDNEGQYCDSYGAFSGNNPTATTVDFNLKNVPMNFFGKMTAKVTYNGNTYTASQNVIALGNTTIDSKQILPRGGYPSDFDSYPSSMVGYVTKADTFGGDDSIVGGWNMAGSDGQKKAEIVEEDGNKFMKITAGTTKKSHMLSNQIASPATQAIFEQNVRFNSSYGVITLTSGYPIWQDKNYSCPVSLVFDGSKLLLNETPITKNDLDVTISKETWYKVVLSVDKTTETAFVKVTVQGLAFDFGAGTDEYLAEGYTAITPETSYSEERGYGIEGVATVGGTASIDNANSDYLEGNNVVFKAKVEPAKVYEVTITYQGVLDSEYVNSDLVGARKTIHNDDTGLAEKTYIIPVVDDVLDLTISSTWTTKEDLDGDSKAETTVTHTTSPRIASISIVKRPDKTANAIPNIYHVGDSTSANNGSWAYRLSNSEKTYPELFSLCKFYNRGAGGRNLCSYYSEGKLQDVLSSIAPGDIVMMLY